MLVALDIFFFVFHTLLTVFNLVGWAFRKTRRLNLITLLLTAFSWVVLGIFYGSGYWFLTDWHWMVRDRLGYETPYNSYIPFFLVTAFVIRTTAHPADTLTLILFVAALTISIGVNLQMKRKR